MNDEALLWLSANLDDLTDDAGRVYQQHAGVFRPESMTEFLPMIEAWRRGTNRKKLRLFTAVCPGPASHSLAEVYPPDIVFTRYYVRESIGNAGSVLPGDRTVDGRLGRTRLDPLTHRRAETVAAAALLSELTRPLPRARVVPQTSYVHGLESLRLRCCMLAHVDPRWVLAMVEDGRRRAVVPDEMLSSVHVAEIEAEIDEEELDTPPL